MSSIEQLRVKQEWLVSWLISLLFTGFLWLLGRLLLSIIGAQANTVVSYGLAIGAFAVLSLLVDQSEKPDSQFYGIERQYIAPLYLAPFFMIPLYHYLAVISFAAKFIIALLVIACLISLIVTFFTGQWALAAVSFVILVVASVIGNPLFSESPENVMANRPDKQASNSEGGAELMDLPVGVTREAYNLLFKGAVKPTQLFAQDLTNLVSTGYAFLVSEGTEIYLIEGSGLFGSSVKIQVAEGHNLGVSGWIPREWFHAITSDGLGIFCSKSRLSDCR